MKRHTSMLLFLGLLTASAVAASVPSQMNVQGRLLNAGSPMTGSHAAVFTIYDDPAAGSVLWTESSSLSVQGGIFDATIGSVSPLPATLFDAQPRWLEVTVDGNTLAPRVRLTTNAYAFRAQRADTADVALSGASGDAAWSTDGSNAWRLTGNVGIGTNAPQAQLDILATSGYDLVFSGDQGANIYAPNQALYLLAGAGQNVSIGSNGANGQVNLSPNLTTSNGDLSVSWHTTGTAGITGAWINTLGNTLGNGSVYGLLEDNYLQFHGTYGYCVGDEYIEFQSGYNPSIGGQGTMARITANRNPEDYDLGRGRLKLSVRNGTSLVDMVTVDNQGVSIPGNLSVGGTKCRAVAGTTYGTLYFNAVESEHANFTASGRSTLRNGMCHIELDPRWLAAVTIDGGHPLDVVAVVFYGPHGEWYATPGSTGFEIVDPAGGNSEFCWTVQARQKGYEDLDLNRPVPTAVR